MKRNTNKVVSIYRNTQSVDSLIRIHNVTGAEFPVSGDAPARQHWERIGDAQQGERLRTHYADRLGIELRVDMRKAWK